MSENIKETYDNIQNLIYSSLNNLIGQKFNKNIAKSLELNIISNINNIYPQYNFEFSLNWSEITFSLNPVFKLKSDLFIIISHDNYLSHDFCETNSHIFHHKILQCHICNIQITENGKILDGDFSCNEYIIKNIIE